MSQVSPPPPPFEVPEFSSTTASMSDATAAELLQFLGQESTADKAKKPSRRDLAEAARKAEADKQAQAAKVIKGGKPKEAKAGQEVKPKAGAAAKAKGSLTRVQLGDLMRPGCKVQTQPFSLIPSFFFTPYFLVWIGSC